MHRDYSILDDLKEGVQIIDLNKQYLYLNKSLLSEIKLTADQVVGHHMIEVFPNIDHTEVYSEIDKCLKEKAVSKFINEFIFPDGRQTFYEINIQPIEEGVIIFSRDITKTKKGEILLRESNKELERFAFISAHHLREPLKLIENLADLLLQDYSSILPAKGNEICLALKNKSHSALEIINEFRDLSEIKGRDLTKIQFNIFDMVREITSTLQKEYPSKKLYMNYPVDEINVEAYPTLVSSLLKQILRNAFQYGENSIEFSVADKEKQIFCLANRTATHFSNTDMFHVDFTEGRAEHAGLGLSICKKIVDRHKGVIWTNIEGQNYKLFFSLLPTAQ